MLYWESTEKVSHLIWSFERRKERRHATAERTRVSWKQSEFRTVDFLVGWISFIPTNNARIVNEFSPGRKWFSIW